MDREKPITKNKEFQRILERERRKLPNSPRADDEINAYLNAVELFRNKYGDFLNENKALQELLK